MSAGDAPAALVGVGQPPAEMDPHNETATWVHTATLTVGSREALCCVALDGGQRLAAYLGCSQAQLLAAGGGLRAGTAGGADDPFRMGVAVVFRLDPPVCSASASWHGEQGRGATPPACPPALRWECDSPVTCAAMLTASLCETSEDDVSRAGESGVSNRRTGASHQGVGYLGRSVGGAQPTMERCGRLLAVGRVDGRVQLVTLNGAAPSGRRSLLPAPHDSCAVAVRSGASDSGASGWPLLGLAPVAPRASLGLLVGAYEWGAALWQVHSHTLINVFSRAEPHAPLSCRAPGGGTGDLVVAVSVGATPGAAAESSRRRLWASAISDDDPNPLAAADELLGYFAISAEWRWRPAVSPGELVHSFALTRTGCTAHRAFSSTLPGQGMEEGASRGERARGRPVIGLAASGSYLAATLAGGWACVWDQMTAECLLTLRFHLETPAFPCITLVDPSEPPPEESSRIALLQPRGCGVMLRACALPLAAAAAPEPVPLALCSVGRRRRPALQLESAALLRMRMPAPAPPSAQIASQSLDGFQEELQLTNLSQGSDISMSTPRKPQFIY